MCCFFRLSRHIFEVFADSCFTVRSASLYTCFCCSLSRSDFIPSIFCLMFLLSSIFCQPSWDIHSLCFFSLCPINGIISLLVSWYDFLTVFHSELISSKLLFVWSSSSASIWYQIFSCTRNDFFPAESSNLLTSNLLCPVC